MKEEVKTFKNKTLEGFQIVEGLEVSSSFVLPPSLFRMQGLQ